VLYWHNDTLLIVLSTTEICWWLAIWNKIHFTEVCWLVLCILQFNTQVWSILNWLWVHRLALTCIAGSHLILNYAIRLKPKFITYTKTFVYKINPLCSFWVNEDKRVAFHGPETIPIVSQRLCFSCITHRHVQTSRRDREANSQPTRDTTLSHTHTHTHTRARAHKYNDTTQRLTYGHFWWWRTPEMHGISWSVSCVLAITLTYKLVSCSKHFAFSDAKYCWFFFINPCIQKSTTKTRYILTNFP